MEIIFLLGGFLIGFILFRILLDKKVVKEETLVKSNLTKYQSELNLIQDKILEETSLLSNLQGRQEEIKNSIEISSAEIDKAGKEFSDKSFSFYTAWLENQQEKEKQIYEQEIANYQNEYAQIMRESAAEYVETFNLKKEELANLLLKIGQQQKIIDALVAANKREEEKRKKESFYKLSISEIDIEEIKQLQSVGKLLRDPIPLNKVIWKYYFENPYNDLVNRVVGSTIKTGIYKITNTLNGMCYIGQAVNIAERFKQHIKRGLGAEAASKNKLYPAMQEDGLENFSFEIIEECPREELNAKEDLYQEIFKAKEFGYSIK